MLKLRNIQHALNAQLSLQVQSLEVRPGTFFALVGPNGAGKSSLLKILSGDIRCQSEMQLHGRALPDWTPRERACHFAVLPQSSHLSFGFSAREVVALGLTPLSLSKKAAQALIDEKMALTDSLRLQHKSYPQLSGGEKQRVQLARVLLQLSQAQLPPVLLLDEPTAAQDLGQQHSVLGLLRRLCDQQHFMVISVLHDLNQVLRYCDTCVVLDQGRIVAQGQPQQVLHPAMVERHWHYRPQSLSVNNDFSALL